jgi:transcription-repair coupling factor (superfamily II helicase)
MKRLREILLPVLEKIRSGRKVVEVSELWGSSRALLLHGLRQETARPLLVITATEEEAEAIVDDLRFFAETLRADTGGPNSLISLFPAWGVLPFEADSPDSATVGRRMNVLYGLLGGDAGIVVTPVDALMQRLPPWELFADSVRTIELHQRADPEDMAAGLAGSGYESASVVTRTGEFSRRGGIIDFYSPAHENPVRLEFFGDTVESLREFDPETQRSIREIRQAVALPVRELIIRDKGTEKAKTKFAAGDAGDDISLISGIENGSFPPGGEFLAPFFYDMDTLFRYFPENGLTAVIEPDDCWKAVEEKTGKIVQGWREEKEEGRILPETEEFYLFASQIEQELSRYPSLHLRLLGGSEEALRMDTRSASWLGIRLTRPAAGEDESQAAEGTAGALAGKLKAWRETNRVYVVSGTAEAATRLRNLFREYGLFLTSSETITDEGGPPWPARVLVGRLSTGFSWSSQNLILITEEEIFGVKVHRPRTARSKAAPFLSSFRELKPGDFVVHTDYGVGEYQGLTHLAVDGFETDFLTLRYEPDAKLYVPLYSLDKVQKYIGAEGVAPRVNRLGAPAWQRTKERVKKDILEMARELVAVYAAREAMRRAPLSPPDNLYREFEAAFPYEETPDQLRAIEDVLADMQKERPMDRLVCGDVGFGKTEVALRAAFKAVEDGYQAAILVPTTLLADQHFRNFSGRLAPFPARVEMLSRFRTKAEQKQVLAGLKAGTVDIVIGTHRLLQRDVAFRNLGLLVVDEEHRFGVRHKERIKEMRKMVDVLTLTATPIPRTLHMSLAGIRDLSIIQTPPLERQAIQVVLARFGKRVIREAILAELGRGGQVFFVQNRVAGIERMAAYLQNLVPEGRIGVAHGQMKEDEIEEVMTKFIAGELNVLVTTSIIESGIDIPNANTIIINRADRFGLAELYQIKGRVGRSRQKAYAYLLTPVEEGLSDVARRRLRAIQELSELGAGFRIAAQDLETRGAGNLLGKQQSGHIAAVGIDLYTEMMEEAMAELKGEEVTQEPDTQINLRASAFIPETYIGDMSLRLAAYKEISSVEGEEELERIAADLEDRYGALPEEASNLLVIMGVKIAAKRSRVARIDGADRSVNITFAGDARVPPEKVMALLRKNRGTIRFIPEYTLRIDLPDPSLAAASEAVKKCLQDLG